MTKKISIFLTFMIMLSLTAASSTASAFDRFDIITTSEMKELLDRREAGQVDFLLVNTLDEVLFRNASIPGSINVPWYKAHELKHMLGQDKDRLIVAYCLGYR